MTDPTPSDLMDLAVDGRLTPEQAAAVEHLVLTDPAARRRYAEAVHLHGALATLFLNPPPTPPASPPRSRWARRRGLLAALAALVAAGLVGWLAWPGEPPAVARLDDTKACKWDAGSLPTEAGAALRPGRLRLAEGIARLTFASGAVVTLEGPADLELLGPLRCRLHRGQLAASVPPAATGFVVETPTSRVTDFGTEFGVTVRDGSTADVQVFSGQVDVLHHPTGRTEAMTTGGRKRFTPDAVRPLDPNADVTDAGPATARPPAGTRPVQVTTAQGRGRDAFVMPMEIPPDRRSDTLLLVKRAPDSQPEWHRKVYLAFDLAGVDGRRLRAAELSLTFAPTGMGFASRIGDATFAVYGLTDERLDDWDEAGLRWATAPANRPGGTALAPAAVVRLGSFVIAQGEPTGTRTVGGPDLVEFLRRDTNRLATLVVVRETLGHGASDLVHGFASRRHPTLPPPTLRLTLDDRR